MMHADKLQSTSKVLRDTSQFVIILYNLIILINLFRLNILLDKRMPYSYTGCLKKMRHIFFFMPPYILILQLGEKWGNGWGRGNIVILEGTNCYS
jgi:hypothetical protein